jgi:hypothetical protein
LENEVRLFARGKKFALLVALAGTVVVNPASAAASPVLSGSGSSSRAAPQAGEVLCQLKAGDWPQTAEWQTVGDSFVNKSGSDAPMVAASCVPQSRDYYVEAEFRPNSSGDVWAKVGVLGRLSLENNTGYKGLISHGSFCGSDCGKAEIHDISSPGGDSVEFGSYLEDKIYRVRLTMKGTLVSLFVDGALVREQRHTSANDPGRVGVECGRPCEVLSFTVVAQ